MKKIILFLSMIFAVACFAVNNPTSTEKPQSSHDGDILAFLITVDNNEIAAANLTNQKSANREVKVFASTMLQQHNQNLEDAMSLSKSLNIQVQDNKKTHELKVEGQKMLNTLNSLNGAAFDKEYIKDMVKGHAEVLNAIDKLSKKPTDPKVKQFLADTRSHVAQHLDEAKKIQSELK